MRLEHIEVLPGVGASPQIGRSGLSQAWEIIDADKRIFRSLYLSCRVDFLLRYISTGFYLHNEYKSRPLAGGRPSDYEVWQTAISHVILEDHLYRRTRALPQLASVLSYGDGLAYRVVPDERDRERIATATFEYANTADSPPVPASELAKTLSGADFSGVSQAARDTGVAQHEQRVSQLLHLLHASPVPSTQLQT